MRKKLFLLAAALLACLPGLRAQVTTEPTPLQEDSQNVTIFYHADEGNKGLINLDPSTHVYAHTGVCILKNDGTTEDWKYAPKWDEDNEKYQLEYVSPNLWKLYIGDIRTYYGVAADETVTKLCFVFRTTGGTKEGKGEGNTDIFVDVMDSGFQLAFRQSRASNIVDGNTNPIKFTASTTQEADIAIYVGDLKIGEAANATQLQATYKFENIGDYDVKAVATAAGKTLEKHITMVYARPSAPDADQTVPPMGLTKNSDGTYTFCFAAPQKNNVMVLGSWNGYQAANAFVMDYVDVQKDGGTFRYFKTKLPQTTTGTEFGYYYLVDGKTNVGDPYARLVLDPYNDKYISADVYPNMPKYPEGIVPAGTLVAWHGDKMLDYKWKVNNFKGADKENLVVYELLFRDFTGTEGKAKGDGTVRAAIEKIPYLKSLGVNVIELLPINEFNGNISWGYNTNFYFAPDKAYGTPQDYKEFIDLCHQNGMAVVLDLVFNQSDGLHPWYKMYPSGSNPFYNQTAPHAYSVLNDWNQGYPLVEQQWYDCVKFWLQEYKVDGYRFDLVKGLGDNTSYANSGDGATNAYNSSRVQRMKRIHDAMREVNPDAYFINENLAGAKEENEMAEDGELNWANVNNAGCQYAMGYSSDSNLARMWATKDGRTAGSTVAYLESHDEQRLGYKQIMWGVAGVKDNHAVAMQRLGSCAAQMLLVPGSHMIWQFSEMGNTESTKDANGGNNTSPKKVDWALLDDPDNAGLVQNYSELIRLRLRNTDLFSSTADYSCNVASWNNGRWIKTSVGNRELYALMNPNVTGTLSMTCDFKQSNNNAYHIVSKSYGSAPMFDAAAKKVDVPANCYVVIASTNVSGVDEFVADAEKAATIFAQDGAIYVVDNDGPVAVYSLGGATVATAKGETCIAVPAGMYVVRAGGKTTKLVVR